MSDINRNRFSGTPVSGLLNGKKNGIFFSPALKEQRVGNEIEVQSIQVTIKNNDAYVQPSDEDTRLFKFGSNGISRTNNFSHRTLFKQASVIGILTQTTPPGPTTTFKIR